MITCLRARDLAAPTERGCKSEMRPLPMGEAKKGIFVVSTNFNNSSPALAYAAPLPAKKINLCYVYILYQRNKTN